jgi:hypothetical protein
MAAVQQVGANPTGAAETQAQQHQHNLPPTPTTDAQKARSHGDDYHSHPPSVVVNGSLATVVEDHQDEEATAAARFVATIFFPPTADLKSRVQNPLGAWLGGFSALSSEKIFP